TVGISYRGYGVGTCIPEETVSVEYARPWRDNVRWGAVANYLRKTANTSSSGEHLRIHHGRAGCWDRVRRMLSSTAWDVNLKARGSPRIGGGWGVTVAHLFEPDLGFYGKHPVDRIWKVGGGYRDAVGGGVAGRVLPGRQRQGAGPLHGDREDDEYFALRVGGGVGAEGYARLTAGQGRGFDRCGWTVAISFPLPTPPKTIPARTKCRWPLGLGGRRE
ncbi:MAG: hypothetical protein IPN19_14475, partial [Elusimicrobia bacterium]|nr:hypothetical protein [Elusimicrobiota bacterium]